MKNEAPVMKSKKKKKKRDKKHKKDRDKDTKIQPEKVAVKSGSKYQTLSRNLKMAKFQIPSQKQTLTGNNKKNLGKSSKTQRNGQIQGEKLPCLEFFMKAKRRYKSCHISERSQISIISVHETANHCPSVL